MAAIIDHKMFPLIPLLKYCPWDITEMQSQQKMGKITKITQDTVTLTIQEKKIETMTRLRLVHCDLVVKLTAKRQQANVTAMVCLLQGSKHWKIVSKHVGLILMRSLAAQRDIPLQGTAYVDQGRIFMNLNGFLLPKEGRQASIAQMYHRILAKNLKAFERILLQTGTLPLKGKPHSELWSQTQQSLHLADILRKTQTNIGISEAKSEFMFANRSFAQQSEQLSGIQKNILSGEDIEQTTKQMYNAFPKEITASHVRAQLVPAFERHIKRLKGLLLLKQIEEKSIEDYNYNVIKVIDVEKDAGVRILGEGATSRVYQQQMKLVYVCSSQGFYSQMNNQEQIERTVAVKRQRQGLESKRDKLAHQRQMVVKLKNNTSIFLPKYFGLPAAPPCAPELASCLLMEKLHGQQLDLYASIRQEAMSLHTKLLLLLNIAQGLRHLHGCGIVHLDVKPFNIIVTRGLIPKIIDFGDSYHKELCSKNFLPGFTFPWVAPEVCLRSLRFSLKREDDLQFSEKQDVFAFGFIMAQLLFKTRVLSLSQQRFQQVYSRRAVLSRVFLSPERGAAYGEELVIEMLLQLMVRCMDVDPGGRPRMEWIGIALRLMVNALST